eukprot:1835006-Pyramimonas_sp.AAC.1
MFWHPAGGGATGAGGDLLQQRQEGSRRQAQHHQVSACVRVRVQSHHRGGGHMLWRGSQSHIRWP